VGGGVTISKYCPSSICVLGVLWIFGGRSSEPDRIPPQMWTGPATVSNSKSLA
jgi:hypothetical protein